jgi:gamma-glutamyltranspeptidase/glutathione hydrolase
MKAMSYDFKSRRSMIMSQRGMAATSHPLASQAALRVLQRGGNAADAAVAGAAVLAVTESASTGIGGDCFALYFDAKTKQVTALNGSGRAPGALTLQALHALGYSQIPERSPHAVTVPGAVAGWEDMVARHGRMTLADVLEDAIYYASEGFPVSPLYGAAWKLSESFLRSSPNTEDYLPDGRAPEVGQVVKLPGLARTLQAIAEGGAEAFYTGPTGEAIVSTLQSLGGMMTLDDLKAHRSTWDAPILTDYRGITVYECPPNGQGIAALLALNIASGWDVSAAPWDSPERMHFMIEAMRLAFADARHYVADPAFGPVPVNELLSPAYAKERRALVSEARAMQPPSFGLPLPGSDTVYFCTADSEGNACSFINSLYFGFGTGIVAKGTGVFLQNRGANFSLDPEHPNAFAPGKRPYHTIIPGMALKDGELWAAFGVMGGFMQPQGHFQVISAMVDDDLNPQEALDRSRFCLLDGNGNSVVGLEEGIPLATMARLAELGHAIQPITGRMRATFGTGQIIRRDPDSGVLYGGSDPRKDGVVAAY